MRVLVISDVHANVNALDAVLAHAGTVDETWCLGDLVGYGPDPNEVVERLIALPNLLCMMGNHDAAVIGQMPFIAFNSEAQRSLEWQKEQMSADSYRFLESLPNETQVRGAVSVVHGSPRDPVWEYVINTLVARLNFEVFTTDYCFVGHSHVQCEFKLDLKNNRVALEIPRVDESLELAPRAILNPGSVGQPRDRDPRAAYAIYDSDENSWTPHRAEYDIKAVQERIRKAGLPERHALRLAEGW
jgi:diadenosine tetraphosphatase ApaH/serine/threonine PP2A family protein phosphatase